MLAAAIPRLVTYGIELNNQFQLLLGLRLGSVVLISKASCVQPSSEPGSVRAPSKSPVSGQSCWACPLEAWGRHSVDPKQATVVSLPPRIQLQRFRALCGSGCGSGCGSVNLDGAW